MSQLPLAFWSVSASELLQHLQTTPQGLTNQEAQRRLAGARAHLLKPAKRTDTLTLLLVQFKSPIILILLFAAGLSLFLHDAADTFIIMAIVLVSGVLSFWQERGAADAVEKLLALVQVKATVLRDNTLQEIPVETIVPGDLVVLSAGDVVPGDCLLQEATDLFVDEASLTGETYPVEKTTGVLAPETPLSQRRNTLWMGTHVISGTARAIIARTGVETEFGKVSARLKLRPLETEFEHGIRRFGYFLMEVTLVLVLAIFAINVYLARPVLESFLFSLALAVGLTPQLLPAIISINLAHGARRMALAKVIVKRLASIENFGSMNVLCSDKTGTLTEGVVSLHSALDIDGRASDKVLLYAYLNAFYETGFINPIDEAIRTYRQFDLTSYQKLGEAPYDFIRKRLSILVATEEKRFLITKSALDNVLAVCSSAETAEGTSVDMQEAQARIQQRFEEFSSKGFRTLGIAYRAVSPDAGPVKDCETALTFLGFLVFFDPPKANITETLGQLKRLGVALKIITGDNPLVTATVSQQVGLTNPRLLTGSDLRHMSNEALMTLVQEVDVFAAVEPNQKERIILALRKAGNVVGYLYAEHTKNWLIRWPAHTGGHPPSHSQTSSGS